jgi:glycine cleavage system H protein
VKAVSEFNSPVGGEIVGVNERLEEEPNLVNDDPYGEGWLVKISGSTGGEDLLDADAYTAMIEAESA